MSDGTPDWRLWKVCEPRKHFGDWAYYEDFKKAPCAWPRCKCERRPTPSAEVSQ